MPTSVIKTDNEDNLIVGDLNSLVGSILITLLYTAKTQYQKFETNIPRKGIARPQSQFPHSCDYERYIYSHDRSVYSAAGNMWTDLGNI